jgi:hypothetical protein
MTAEAEKRSEEVGGRRVRQVAVPSAVHVRSTLAHVDYEDAFMIETGVAQKGTGEQWARAMLEGAPLPTRRSLRRGWSALGLRLGSSRSDRLVLGWEVRRRDADRALLGAAGRLGISGELLFEPSQGSLLFATFVQLDHPVARLVWRGIAPHHRHVVQRLLQRLATTERRDW